ncbi:glycosyl transferase [Rhizobium rhizosphaerae]|uniref:Glycosyl transferase n=2 Tax=Xaviernesmea rhizosphaerae TaxID=1672749 RepID=A0A1Q9AEC1_9HYPH|nr:glycosyl transferase [Xaviernesmea rhizosphaerae]
MHGKFYPAMPPMATAVRTQSVADAVPAAEIPRFPATLLQEGADLLALGLPKPVIARAMRAALEHGTSVESECCALGVAEELLYHQALAKALDLPFIAALRAGTLHDGAHLDTQLLRPEILRLHHPGQAPTQVIVPRLADLDTIWRQLEAKPGLRRLLAVTTPRAVRQAVWEAGAERRLRAATSHLFENWPLLSARIVLWGKQGFVAGVATGTLVAGCLALPTITLIATHLVLAIIHLAGFGLRLSALVAAQRLPAIAPPPPSAATGADLPIYSVMVALHREEAVVGQLIAALDRLEWPKSRLDIKLICEADDHETLQALSRMVLGGQYEIVRVPPGLPRTKPKALNYGLAGARGSIVAIYDAEDRPAPLQLLAAWAQFRHAPAELACLQAPIVITNGAAGALPALFALEYAALFRGLLPRLAAARLPLPLGGTSNHFRTEALRRAGGWDPFNVTEDADLGLRLARMGWRTGMIAPPTYEDAPTDIPVWVRQRTRWFKGWLQTWLVCMRRPRHLRAQLGWPAFITLQILIGGLLIAALSHPLILVFLAYFLWLLTLDAPAGRDLLTICLFTVDALNIVGCYAIQILLGLRSMREWERRAVGRRWALIPLYWLLMSYAAWTAVIELRSTPFRWNKTPHKPVQPA